MPSIRIILNGDECWPDLKDGEFHHITQQIQIAILDKGMSSGRPSIAIRIDMDNGEVVVAETSARLFVSTARAIHARYPNLLEGD